MCRYTNSFISHAVSDTAVGPYTYSSTVRGIFSHGPVASVHDDTLALIHVGCGEPQEGPEETCDGSRRGDDATRAQLPYRGDVATPAPQLPRRSDVATPADLPRRRDDATADLPRRRDDATPSRACAIKEGTAYRMDGYDTLYTTALSSLGRAVEPSWEDHGQVLWWPGEDPCNPRGNASAPTNRLTNPSIHIFANGSALMAFRWQCDGDGDRPDAGSAPSPGRRIGLAYCRRVGVADGSRRRRGCDIPWKRSRRRRGRDDADIPWKRSRRRDGRDADNPWRATRA